jgi:hypothetical protein
MRPRHCVAVVLIGALLAVGATAVPTSATTTTRALRPLGPMSNSWAGTSQILAYARDRSTLVLRTRSATQVASFPDVAGRYDHCAVYAARSVVALVSCFRPGADGADPYLVRFGRTPVQVVGGQPLDLYVSLGRYWLGGVDCTYEPSTSCTPVSLNIRTGERVTRAVDLNRSDPSPPPPVRRFPRFSGALWLPGKGTRSTDALVSTRGPGHGRRVAAR